MSTTPTPFQLLDDTDISLINVRHLRRHIALVGQEPTLFNLTIRENIVYGMQPEPTEEEIRKAATLANAHQFIMELPEVWYCITVTERIA